MIRFPTLPDDLAEDAISFDTIDVDLPELLLSHSQAIVSTFLLAFAKTHDASIASLDYIFCSDEELLSLNTLHLNHDTYTDIITFDLSDENSSSSFPEERDSVLSIEGECYISLDRIQENAASFSVSPTQELVRVMAHGLLHLCGHKDKLPEDISRMRRAEEAALKLWQEFA